MSPHFCRRDSPSTANRATVLGDRGESFGKSRLKALERENTRLRRTVANLTVEKALGPDHPRVATALENYAALLRKTGRGTEASKLEARAKAIRAKPAERNPAN